MENAKKGEDKNMTAYKRIVSYLYYYGNGEKKNNVGYVRMEQKNGQYKVTIHVRSTNSNDKSLGVYFFYRENKQLIGISLGNMTIKGGVGEFQKLVEEEITKNLQIPIEEMSGIIIYENNAHFFATQWDDVFINIMDFYIENSSENNSKKWMEEMQSISEQEENLEVAELIDIEVQKKQKVDETTVKQEENIEKNIVNYNKIEKENSNYEIDLKTIEIEKESLNLSKKIEEIKESADEKLNEKIEKKVKKEELPQETMIQSEQINQKETREDNKTQNSNQKHMKQLEYEWRKQVKEQQRKLELQIERAKKIFDKFPDVDLCNKEKIKKCVRIEPQDIGNFPMENWVLANNSFLLHGYYHYKYLIFGLYFHEGQWEYIIGVPGIYEPKERFMGKMFGFQHFCPTNQNKEMIGAFGYWYQVIRL